VTKGRKQPEWLGVERYPLIRGTLNPWYLPLSTWVPDPTREDWWYETADLAALRVASLRRQAKEQAQR
jgi:hypothetical protein